MVLVDQLDGELGLHSACMTADYYKPRYIIVTSNRKCISYCYIVGTVKLPLKFDAHSLRTVIGVARKFNVLLLYALSICLEQGMCMYRVPVSNIMSLYSNTLCRRHASDASYA